MEKINFQNGKTPLNDTNLNKMQDNMEEVEEKITNLNNYLSFFGTKNRDKVGTSFDLNNLLNGESCYYSTNDGLPANYAGSVENTNYFIICMNNVSTYGKIQICFPDGSTSDNNIYIRFRWGSWTSWRKIELASL